MTATAARLDYLPGTDLQIRQDPDQYHFNSDTALLGSFLQLRHQDHVLDIGCSSGALLLYASLDQPAGLAGIDLFPEAIALAEENLRRYGLQAELQAVRLQEYQHAPFDRLICNPPYFTADQQQKANRFLQAGRHESFLPLKELLQCSSRLLKDYGSLSMVHRVSRMPEVLASAAECGLHPIRIRIAYESSAGPGKTFAVELRKAPQQDLKWEPPLFLDCPMPKKDCHR